MTLSRRTAANVLIVAACALMTFLARYRGYEGEWAPIEKLMTHPEKVGVFGHRLLFVGVAALAKLVMPGLTYLQAFYVSQLVACAFTFAALSWWIWRLLGHHYVAAAALLLTVMLAPALTYYNFYDVAIVGFYALCLGLLWQERLTLYFVVFALGLWNHENMLLLAGVAGLWLLSRRHIAPAIAVGSIHVVLYALYRVAVRIAIPHDALFDSRVSANLHFLASWGALGIAISAATLALPLIGAALGYKSSPRFVRVAAIALFAGLAVVTTLFGQYNEARQWVAFYPLAIPMVLRVMWDEPRVVLA